jgi:nucleoid-associated protein YgaU
MTRETKIGLFVGMGVIILIGILISDHLSLAQRQQSAMLAETGPQIQPDLTPPAPGAIPALNHAVALSPPPAPTNDLTAPLPPRPTDAPRNATVITQDGGSNTITSAGGSSGIEPNFGPATKPLDHDLTALGNNAAPKQTVHFVKEHETLSQISQQYFGDRTHAQAIYEANKDKMSSINALRPGVRLVIPTPTKAATPALTGDATLAPTPAPAPAPSPDKVALTDYKVGEGDTLVSIAEKFYGSKKAWQKLYALNKEKIPNPDRLKPGTVISVPKN